VNGPVRQRIVDVVPNRPDGITRGELIDAVYAGDLDGGPDSPNTISLLSISLLCRTPVIGFFLVVEIANTGDKWVMAVFSSPIDCFLLCFEGSEYVIGMVFDHIIINVTTFRAALRSGLNINIRHDLLS
jgi:hypothetical protein